MSDIVERLRNPEPVPFGAPRSGLLDEAADEIERLRKDNKHWQAIASQGIAIEHELHSEIERKKIGK